MAANPSVHDEVEIKLDASPEFPLPDLSGLPGVTAVEDGGTHELSAHYLDSPDLLLIRHRTTFRRRTGGTDEGWHLKLPAGKKGRTEIHEPLGEGIHDVPANLMGLVRVQLRGAAVEPVARIVTQRTIHRLIGADGAVLAEVADDLVTAEALGETLTTDAWREIEVELDQGSAKLLTAAQKLLVKAGARPADVMSKLERTLQRRLASQPALASPPTGVKPGSAGAVALEYLSQQAQALLAEDPHVRLDIKDGVHQMRVATRKLRTALSTFKPVFEQTSSDPVWDVPRLREELKWLATVLGAARDAEVMREHLKQQVADLPAELVLGPVARRIDLELNSAHQAAHAAAIETLDGERYLELVRALEAFLAAPPLTKRASGPAAKELRSRVRSACRTVSEAVDDADAAGTATEREVLLHEVRKKAKRARYAADAALPVIGKPAKRVSTAMEAIQEDLGDHQDAVVERAWLRDLGARAFVNGENGFTFGLLHGLTALRAEHDEQEFARRWTKAQATLANWPA